MLVINNGVPKSGTTMFQKMLRRIRRFEPPSAAWQNDWNTPSVGKDRIVDCIRDGEWREKDILIKLHQGFNKNCPVSWTRKSASLSAIAFCLTRSSRDFIMRYGTAAQGWIKRRNGWLLMGADMQKIP